MKRSILAASAILFVAGTSLVYAEAMPPPEPRPIADGQGPSAFTPMPPPPPGGPDGRGPRARGPMPPPPPPSPAAHFHVERAPYVVDVKCADDQPMKACADITQQLVDRLPAERAR